MRRYETIFIIDPDLSSDERAPLLVRIKDLIPQQGGLLIKVDEWGSQKLAYEIKKKARGYYVLLDYCGTGALVDEIERLSRIDDRILKYMSVLLEKDVDLEKVKEDIAREEAKDDQSDESEVEQETSDAPELEVIESESNDESKVDQETSELPESEAIKNETNDESEVNQETSELPESEAIENETIQPKSNKEEL
jgi:small subunit ribosomal protein S6